MQVFDFRRRGTAFQELAIVVGAITTLTSLGLFAYLGTFTRYLADDYCEMQRVTSGNILRSLLQRYLTTSDRFSNLLFVGVAEFLAPRNVQILPVAMIALWTAALIWLVFEARRLLNFQWSVLVDILLGGLLAFFPIFEAPNRFQTIYWRSGMATHFAPLVYLTFFVALLLMLIRRNEGRMPALWLGPLCLLIAFFGGGFSEPPDAMLIAGSLLALAALWFLDKGPRRKPALYLLAWTFAGGLLALIVMALSPGNQLRLGTPPPALPVFAQRTALYPLQFIGDSLVTLPLPTIVSVAGAALLFYTLFACVPVLSSAQSRGVLFALILAPMVMYLMIAASFAPSVYGQAYPVERARFAGRLMMTTATLLEGACLGVLAAQWQVLRSKPLLVNLASVLLVLAAIYPLRAAGGVLAAELPYAKRWATAWDARQATIYADKAAGKQAIIVPQLPGFEHVKELDPRPKMWVNRCAAAFYGVKSIRAPELEYFP
jgi:hypothetical protein